MMIMLRSEDPVSLHFMWVPVLDLASRVLPGAYELPTLHKLLVFY